MDTYLRLLMIFLERLNYNNKMIIKNQLITWLQHLKNKFIQKLLYVIKI